MLQSSKVMSYTDGGKLLLLRKKKLVCLAQSDATFDHPQLLESIVMPYEEPNPPPRIQEVRKAPSTARDLRLACETAAEIDGEVVVAVRQFPSSEYTYFYNPHDVSYVRSKLELDGYAVDSKIVMDSKCSKLILVIENENESKRSKIVHAEKLK
jgi:hypothetical protein